MLRTLFLIVALAVLIAIGLVAIGFINLNRGSDGSLSIDTGKVEVGTSTTNVQLQVPNVTVKDDDQASQAQPANSQ